jgi:high-affinity iron transporter
MVGSALILLREGLEAALIVAIVLAYLRKLDRRDRFGSVWLGTAIAGGIAIGVGVVLFLTVGELEGDARKWTFAIIMASAAAVLTWMIFWMRKQARLIKGELQAKVDTALVAGSTLALAAVVFFGVLREGIETVLFYLAAAGQTSTVNALVGGTLGMVAALVLAYAFYRGASWLDLRQFFMISGALVLLFAAGLLSRAFAELQVLGAIPTFWYPVFDVSSFAPLATDHFGGQLLRGLFGWDPAPSIEELLLWVTYIGVVGVFYFRGVGLPRLARRSPAPAEARVETRVASPAPETSDA